MKVILSSNAGRRKIFDNIYNMDINMRQNSIYLHQEGTPYSEFIKLDLRKYKYIVTV